jgi:hypothetical protein
MAYSHGVRIRRIDNPREGGMNPRKRRWVRHNDIDEALVEAAVAGQDTPPLGTDERVAAVRRLAANGLSDREVAGRLWWWRDCDPATVAAFRLRHGIPAGYSRTSPSAA